jgi:predicted GNAT family acetyltransferase
MGVQVTASLGRMTDAIEVRDNPDESRYELLLDGELAGVADYRDRAGRRIFVHTVVDPAFSGRGLGNRLARGALDDALEHGLPIVPRCPFIRSWLERHPEYAARLVG